MTSKRNPFAFAGDHTRETFAANYDRFVEDVVLPEVRQRGASA